MACQSYHIKRAGFDADSTSSAQFRLKIENHGFSVLHFIDFLVCHRIYCEEFERIDRACHHTVVATDTTVHVHV